MWLRLQQFWKISLALFKSLIPTLAEKSGQKVRKNSLATFFMSSIDDFKTLLSLQSLMQVIISSCKSKTDKLVSDIWKWIIIGLVLPSVTPKTRKINLKPKPLYLKPLFWNSNTWIKFSFRLKRNVTVRLRRLAAVWRKRII